MRAPRIICMIFAAALVAAPAVQSQNPSYPSDSIHNLAVDPQEHPEEAFVQLLDDGYVKVEKDGRTTRTYRVVRQILKQAAVRPSSEYTFAYDSTREAFKLNWMRVLGTDGTVLSAEPLHVQEAAQPVPMNSPVYTSYRVVRVSLGNVAPGTIVDYSFTTTMEKPLLAGDVASAWRITTGSTVRRSHFVLDAPADMAVRVREKNVTPKPFVKSAGGRVLRTWEQKEIARFDPEPFAADSNGVVQTLDVIGPVKWSDVARWYAGLARDRYQVTDALSKRLAEVSAGATDKQQALRKLHRWVAQDIRYVSLSLGMAGYQPRMPAEVLASMSGDCKDKATLFVTLARALGAEAYPVLARNAGRPDADVPTTRAFDHMIAAVRMPGEKQWTFVDLTAHLTPYGEIPPPIAGEFGLLVKDNGSFEEVKLPSASSMTNRSVVSVSGTLNAEGRFTGVQERRSSGVLQYDNRARTADVSTQKQREELAASYAARVFKQARADSIQMTSGRALDTLPLIRTYVTAENVLKPAGDAFVFTLPFQPFNFQNSAGQLERGHTRKFPIDVARVYGPVEIVDELTLQLPDGWKADLPKGVTAESAFGVYNSTYDQSGNQLIVRRMIRGKEGTQPPTAVADLIAWFRKINSDDVAFIMLRR